MLPSVFYVGSLVVTYGYLLSLGARGIGRDSSHYLGNSPIRSPLYPLILDLYHQFFEVGNYTVLIFLQIGLGLAAVIYLARTLQNLFKLPEWTTFVFTIVLWSPYFFGDYKFGNAVLTEAVCYPLYMLLFAFLVKGLCKKQPKELYKVIGCLVLLMLTRRQFLFVYPLFAIGLAYAWWFFKDRKPLYKVLAVFVLSIVVTDLLERSYAYMNHGKFSTVPFVGFQLSVAPLYFSQNSDAELFEEPLVRELFIEVHKRMTDKGITYETFDPRVMDFYGHHYAGSYNPICWLVVRKVLAERGINDWYEIDRITMQWSKVLLLKRPLDHIKLFFHAVKEKMGGYYLMLLHIVLLTVSFFACLLRQNLVLSTVTLFATLATFGNYTLVSLVEPILRRYASYTETIQLCVLLTLLLVAIVPSVFSSRRLEPEQA